MRVRQCLGVCPSRRGGGLVLVAGLLGGVFAACGGGDEAVPETSDSSGETAPSVASAEGTSAQPWPHCAEYRRLLDAIARLDSAEFREDSEAAEFIADLELESATADYEVASSAAVAAAEELAADESADSEARQAAEVALAAFTAAVDAARLVVLGDSVEQLDTQEYAEAFDLALEAVRGASGDGQDIGAWLAETSAEIATLEAEIDAEFREAAGERLSERREQALADKQETLAQLRATMAEMEAAQAELELEAAQAEMAAAQAELELEAAQARLAAAQVELDDYRASLASATAELAAATTTRLLLETDVADLSSLRDEAYSAAAAAQNQLEQALDAARVDVEAAAETARVDADLQARALEAVATIASAFGDSNSSGDDVAYIAAFDTVYNELARSSRLRATAENIARDAALAAQAAMLVRLDDLARRTGLDANIVSAFESYLSARIAAWNLAEDRGDSDRRAAEMVRQPVYDDIAYRAAARLVRVAVAEAVPSAQSVAAAEAEDVYWAPGGAAHEAFVAARDRISAARVDRRGLVNPGTDEIAWRALHVALDVLENQALAEAVEVRNRATETEDPEADRRVVDARAEVERATAVIAQAESNWSNAELAYSNATAVVTSRENDVSWLQSDVDDAEDEWNSALGIVKALESELAELQIRVTFFSAPVSIGRAQRAAWGAVSSVTGCM